MVSSLHKNVDEYHTVFQQDRLGSSSPSPVRVIMLKINNFVILKTK